ncbi:MAG: glycosyltransferase family 4 protein [Armatimonadota bacterium]|nr:glycosyltransferase family 4 protein [Armatimonadota bacterium]
MNVLLVSGGNIPIPPPRWGGVENLIWQQKCALERAGHRVTIMNESVPGSRKYFMVRRARPQQYDVVHLHLDSHAKYWLLWSRLLGFPLVISTHYGYAAFPEHWNASYRRTFRWLRRARFLILISHEIQRVFERLGCRGQMFALPNGIDCAATRFAPTASREAIVLGRIERRKQQALLAQALDSHTVACDFVGPKDADTGFTVNDRNTRYLGEWSRQQVQSELTEYACLVLLSDGEGHAAVVSEAMAAGLSLVLSPEASHNLDLDKPWIYIVDREKDALGDVLQKAVRENPQYRAQIRRYCEEQFDWNVILPDYVGILEQIARQGKQKRK